MRLVLFQPDIPQNAGAMMRLAACLGVAVDIIEPCGFLLSDRHLRRAGLDYHEWTRLREHRNLEAFVESVAPARLFAFTTKGSRPFHQVNYRDGDALLFGPETRGLPDAVLTRIDADHRLRLPMVPESRSLNLSNTVAVAVYEAWRQQGFPGAKIEP